ncbi:MAG: Transcriptional regulator, LysR family [Nitrospira sp.]|nr:MAG: Transcriptional regulator, LysR family [Nitrospira sp.]
MNLSQLRFVTSVASTGSFTLAAAECCVTQPTLSNGIAQLEDELGARLFIRTTRRVGLTPFGAHVLPYMAEILKAQTVLALQANVFLHPDQRLIRIGTSPLVDASLLGLMIEPFRRDNPKVDIVLREMNMTDLYQMLDRGLLDYVFGMADTPKKRWSTTILYDEPLLFIPPGPGWLTVPRRESVNLKDISNETYVMVPDACGLARVTRALFRSQKGTLKEYSGKALSYHVLQDWTALGMGAAILPKSKITEGRQLTYPIKDRTGQEVRITFEAIWFKNKARAHHLQAFEQHLRKVVPHIVRGTDRQKVDGRATPTRQQKGRKE